jgi:hypothetical protein
LGESISDLFQTHCPSCDQPTPLWHVVYGLRRRCACGEVVVVDSLTLRQEPGGLALRWCADCAELHDGSAHCHRADRRRADRLIEKGQAACERCGGPYQDRLDRPFYARYVLLAVAGHCPEHGLFHKSPDRRDEAVLARADAQRESLTLPTEAFCVEAGDKSIQLIHRGVTNYLDLFSSRQLAYLAAAIRYLPREDAIVRLNLALLVSTSLEFNSMLCGYKGASRRRAGTVRHAFSHHGYSFPFTAVENNPIYPRQASGTLKKLFYSRIIRGRHWAAAPAERELGGGRPRFVTIAGERDDGQEVNAAEALSGGRRFFLMQGSASVIPAATGSIDAVITDPPYYDSIQYGDLAAFFRVWLRQLLPDAAEWSYDGSVAAVSSERAGDGHRYAERLGSIFRECRRVLRPESGRLIFTFHHWRPQAWAALTLALYGAGFRLLNRYVVHAEHPMSVHISKVRALTHDAILVLAADDGGLDWERQGPTDSHDSYHFTASCATFLGWVLAQPDLSAEGIERLWSEAFVA